MRRAAVLLLSALAVAGCERVGETCSSDDDCGDLICRRPRDSDGGLAAMGVCAHARLELGATCASTPEGASGLWCSNELPHPERERFGTCVMEPDAGE